MALAILSAAYEGLSLMEYRRILYKTECWKVAMGTFWVPFLGIAIPFLALLLWHTVRASRRRIEAITKEDETSAQEKKDGRSSNCQEHRRYCCGLFRLFHTRYSLWCAAYLLVWNTFHFSSLISPARVTLSCILYARVGSDKSLKTFKRTSTDERKRKHTSS